MKKIISSLLIILAFTSCSDELLNKKPLDKLSESAVFESADLMNQYVVALYQVIPQPYTEGSLAACTDEAYFRFGGTSTRYIANGNMTADMIIYIKDGGQAHNTRLTLLSLWPRVFSYIRDMNIFLSRVDDAQVPEDVKARLKGEVLFLRAWTYSNMLVRYGGVPVIKEIYQLQDDYDIVRNKYDDCVDFIIKDLDEAIGLLPDKPVVKGRIGADLCKALKARTYLYAASPLFNDPSEPNPSEQNLIFKGKYDRNKWKLAKDAAYEVIKRANAGAYSLANYDDYWKNAQCPEVIWAKYYDATTSYGGDYGYSAQLYYAPAELGGWHSILPVENIVCDYEMAETGKKPFEAASGYNPADPWGGRDPRFYKTILSPESAYMGDTVHICKPAAGNKVITKNDQWYSYTTGTNGTGFWLSKWVIEEAEVSEKINTTLMYPWFRLAEIYLIYAEACLEYNDDVAACAEYLNKVRDRADVMMPHIPASLSIDQMRKKVIQERRIELAFENFRYFDLRRWKIAMDYENRPVYRISGERRDDNTIIWHIAKPKAIPDGEPDYSDSQDLYGSVFPDATKRMLNEHYLVPIPRNEWEKSKGKIVQNPGY
jgi:hypothetical protein